MKYGMRERISGVVIVLALAVIFLPMLLDEPSPREERPKPQMSVEKPIEVERQEVESPKPPAGVGSMDNPMPQRPDADVSRGNDDSARVTPLVSRDSSTNREPSASGIGEPSASDIEPSASDMEPSAPVAEPDEPAPESDPIAELAEQRQTPPEPATQPSSQTESKPSAAQGSWSVQAGSFGQADNAERLESKLKEQGFDAYRRQRDNNLTTVYVGPYRSSEAGEKARGELKAKANIQGLLVRTDR